MGKKSNDVAISHIYRTWPLRKWCVEWATIRDFDDYTALIDTAPNGWSSEADCRRILVHIHGSTVRFRLKRHKRKFDRAMDATAFREALR